MEQYRAMWVLGSDVSDKRQCRVTGDVERDEKLDEGDKRQCRVMRDNERQF